MRLSCTTLISKGRSYHDQTITFTPEAGAITALDQSKHADAQHDQAISIDGDDIILPGLIELQTNGLMGVHFTTLGVAGNEDEDERRLQLVARQMAKDGVTAWYATVPTVARSRWKEILPLLRPRSFAASNGAPLLGAHVEGPFMHPSKRGAHAAEYLSNPSEISLEDLYGTENLQPASAIKLITLAPELPGSMDLIKHIRSTYPHIRVALGHSTASYAQGNAALEAGATGLTHVFNAMPPLQHREPGLAGLIARPPSGTSPGREAEQPFYSLIPDMIHVHPTTLRLALHANKNRAMLITDSIELTGMPDGVYPPNGQITYDQLKVGNRVTNVPEGGEEGTLVGSCITLVEGVQNVVRECGMAIEEVTEFASGNIAKFMGLETRGRLEVGARADFVVLRWDEERKKLMVRQTWIGGVKTFDAEEG